MYNIDELVMRVETEKTAILFLGQNFENRLFVKALNNVIPANITSQVYDDNEDIPYSELIENIVDYCEENHECVEKVITNIKIAESQIIDNRVDILKQLRWNGIVTSLMNEMPGFQSFRTVASQLDIKNDYFSKKNPYITYLFGKSGNSIANIPTSIEGKMVSQAQKNEFFTRIISQLKIRGILVIDGWSPQEDWVKIDDFNTLISLPEKSVFIFSANDSIKKSRQIKKLVEKKVAVLFEESLYKKLSEAGYGYYSNNSLEEDTDGIEITMDSVYDYNDVSVKKLEYKIVNQLDSSINILDDTILDNPNYIDREEYFMRFLSTGNEIPLWGGYSSEFYFKRDKDDELLDAVEKQLKNSDPSKNRVVILEGHNSSGKTAMLGNLACTVRKMKKYPVIYITSRMNEKKHFDQLEKLLKNHINAKLGARKTLIVWDKNTYDKDEVYEELKKRLEECNVVIVGSAYIGAEKLKDKKKGFEIIRLDDHLKDDTEIINLGNVLESINVDYTRNFRKILEEIKKYADDLTISSKKIGCRKDTDKGNWFLLIFYRLFEELHSIQRDSVTNEVELAKNNVSEWINNYLNDVYSNSVFGKMYEQFGFEQIGNVEECTDCISDVFNMLAIAGKYSLGLPAMIVYRAYEKIMGNWNEFIQNIDKNSVVDMDFNDDDGSVTIYFLRALESTLFLEKQAGSYEELLDLEVKSLLNIIENTNFYDMDGVSSEALQVVNLVRKFGPNGPEPGRYKKYFETIAAKLNQINDGANDEVVLVSSHMIREAIEKKLKDEGVNEQLLDARTRLRRAINKYGNDSKSKQLVRLKVEISANLLLSIQSDVIVNDDNREAFDELNSYLEAAMRVDFTKYSAGVFFDASIRMYSIEKSSKRKDILLSRMLQVVDDVNDAQFSDFGDNIHNKIIDVLSLAEKYEEIEEENIKLIKEKSDVGIYRNAMKILGNYSLNHKPNSEEKQKILDAITLLEEYIEIVKSKPRSLYLYIRLLWLKMTNHPPFTEKQFVSLTEDEWCKIASLCNCYIKNEEAQIKPLPYFLLEIYAFRRGNIKEFKKIIEITREFKYKFSAYITYIILCDEKEVPLNEDIVVKKSNNRRTAYSAVFENTLYEGVEAHFKDSNFKDIIDIYDGTRIKNALVGFNLYGVVVYGKDDLYNQIKGGR